MASLSELIKGFRANVREGLPCGLMFSNGRVTLYPATFREDARWGKTHVGRCEKPTTTDKESNNENLD